MNVYDADSVCTMDNTSPKTITGTPASGNACVFPNTTSNTIAITLSGETKACASNKAVFTVKL